jgi:hypothetical protein
MDVTSPTFASFLTPEGIIVAGGLITALIQVVKATFPIIDQRVSGAVLAFSASALLYVATALVVGISTPDAALTVVASWIACATASVGVYASVKHAQATG